MRGAHRITIGRDVHIGRRALLDARGGPIRIGDRAWIAPDATVLTGDPVTHAPTNPTDLAPGRFGVTIGAGARIGARALLMPGAQVGAMAVVAAQALVSGDVPAHAIVAGCPARLVGRRDATDGSFVFASDGALPHPTGDARSPALASP